LTPIMREMKFLLQKAAERLLRLFLPDVHRRIASLEWRLKCNQQALDFALKDDWCRWLYLNRGERLDATVDFFDPDRCRFHLERYLLAADDVENKAVADIASGTGYGTKKLRTIGKAASVVGIDIDPLAVDYAAHKHACEGVRYVCASGDRTGLDDGSIDVVVSFETIEHVPDDNALIREMSRLLRAGGRLICSTPNRWPLEVAEHHLREYDVGSFRQILEGFFEVNTIYNQNSGTPTAPFNRGQPAGIVETTTRNAELAECFIAVCTKPTA
jgi:2-polyprenyl-3-methyl-5-hydroxy-6-metoxy-1,4-benzoquinol methylase